MNADITKALIDLVLAVSTVALGALVTLIRKHFTVKQIELAESIAGIAVAATEQMAKAAGWNPSQKLKSALGDARDLGAKHGVRLTDEQWRTLVEQEVANLKRYGGELTKPDAPITPPSSGSVVKVAIDDQPIATVPITPPAPPEPPAA